MFPSSGYFRGMDCPFFASGLCDRPNCHYRHAEESASHVPAYIPTAQPKPSSLLGLVGIATKQLSRTTDITSFNGAPQYIPTPISVLEQLKKQKSSGNAISLQRVTLGDVAQFGAENFHDISESTTSANNVFAIPNSSTTSANNVFAIPNSSKRKIDDLEYNASKKPKLDCDTTELNKSDYIAEQSFGSVSSNKNSFGSVSSNKNSFGSVSSNKKIKQNCDVLKSGDEKSIAKEKSIVIEKPVKKGALNKIDVKLKDEKKNAIKKDEVKSESCKVDKTCTDPSRQKNLQQEIKSTTTKDTSPQKKISSSSLVCATKISSSSLVSATKISSSSLANATKKSSSIKLPKESSDKKSLPTSGNSSKNNLSRDHQLKSKDVSKKSQSDLESLKKSESLQLQMALFGNAVSGSKSKRDKTSDEAIRFKSKSGAIKIEKVKLKEDKLLETAPSRQSTCTDPSRQSTCTTPSRQSTDPKTSKSITKSNNSKSTKINSSFKETISKIDKKQKLHESIELFCHYRDIESGVGDDDDILENNHDDDEDDDDDDVTLRMKECYKIYLEMDPRKHESQEKEPPKPSTSAEGPITNGKKRIAHLSSSNINNVAVKHKSMNKDHQQVMLERLTEARQHQTHMASTDEPIRMAPKPNHFTGLSTKGSQRVAHVPCKEILQKPAITFNVSSKLVPINTRTMHLSKIIDKCKEIYDSEQDACTRALEEEKSLMTNCASKFVYNSRLVSLIMNLNREIKMKHGIESPSDVAIGGNSRDDNFNRHGSSESPPLTMSEMYKRLKVHLLSSEQLKEHGFPFRDPETRAIIATPNKKYSRDHSNNENLKICCRCGRQFVVLSTGVYQRQDECTYHWGPCWKKRFAGNIESRYNCCGGSSFDRGCVTSEFHVHEDNKFFNLTGFVSTLPCSPRLDEDYGIYALDCEMVYTMAGCELARLTVIDFNFKVVYDKLVKPDSQIVDYNTRFSGIKKEDMDNVRTTLRDVQAVILTMFNDKTILVGHSLENDLLSLKILHQNIVDTSVVFPHKLGFPCKRALRNLTVEVLKKTIQQNMDGHDSKEDASACMELMIHKVKEDIQRSKISIRHSMPTPRSFF